MRPRPIRPSLMLLRLSGNDADAQRAAPWSVHCADDVLIPVDDRAGNHAAALRQQEHHEVGDLVGLAQAAHRKRLRGLLAPVIAGAVEGALRSVLTLSSGPADVEPVDTDAVEAVGMRRVA